MRVDLKAVWHFHCRHKQGSKADIHTCYKNFNLKINKSDFGVDFIKLNICGHALFHTFEKLFFRCSVNGLYIQLLRFMKSPTGVQSTVRISDRGPSFSTKFGLNTKSAEIRTKHSVFRRSVEWLYMLERSDFGIFVILML